MVELSKERKAWLPLMTILTLELPLSSIKSNCVSLCHKYVRTGWTRPIDEDGGPSTSKRSKFGSTANADCQAVRTNTTVTSTERIFASELNERIFLYVSNSNSFSFANFGFLKLGPLCNASESYSFSEANCHVKTVKNENNLALILEFSQLFSRGTMLLSDVKNNRRELDQQEIAAIRILDNFFKEKGKVLCRPTHVQVEFIFSSPEQSWSLSELLLSIWVFILY